MMKILIISTFFFLLVFLPTNGFSQLLNDTLANEPVNGTLGNEPVNGSTLEKEIDITIWVIVFLIGGILLVFYRNHRFFDERREKYRMLGRSNWIVSETKYDNFDIEKLEKITNRLISNYRILTTIYAVLFTFIISTNLEKAFSNWTFIIWTGWTLAILVRTGVTSLELSDIIEIIDEKTIIKTTARKIYAFNIFVKHALYLLVPAVAFVPVLIFNPEVPENFITYWSQDITILSVAFGIMGVFIFVFWLVVRVSEFIYNRGSEGFYIFAILFLVFGSLSLGSDSPLEPKLVSFAGIVDYIPSVLFVTLQIGFIGGGIGLLLGGQFFLGMFYYKFKKNKKG